MNSKVMLTISSVHMGEDGDAPFESTALGEYSFAEGMHIVDYEEAVDLEEVSANVCKCTLKLSKDRIELQRDGDVSTRMVFEKSKATSSLYHTPYGDFDMVFTTTELKVTESQDEVTATLTYEMSVGGAYVSSCTMNINIISK